MFITNLIRTFGDWRHYPAAVRQLSALDDRGVEDIGLNRSMIRASCPFRDCPLTSELCDQFA